jgi:hypothetical protein
MSNENKKRIIFAIMCTFRLKNEIIETLISDLSYNDKHHLNALKNFPMNEKADERVLEYKERKDNNKEFKFNTLRSCFKLETIVEKCCKGELDFPFLDKPEGFFQKKKNYLMSNLKNLDLEEEELENKIILFVVGGISINEVVALEKLMKENSFGVKLIIGSTYIYSPEKFIDDMKNIEENKNDNLSINVEEDSMIKTNQINPEIVNK